jgi:hypothetical protein
LVKLPRCFPGLIVALCVSGRPPLRRILKRFPPRHRPSRSATKCPASDPRALPVSPAARDVGYLASGAPGHSPRPYSNEWRILHPA